MENKCNECFGPLTVKSGPEGTSHYWCDECEAAHDPADLFEVTARDIEEIATEEALIDRRGEIGFSNKFQVRVVQYLRGHPDAMPQV